MLDDNVNKSALIKGSLIAVVGCLVLMVLKYILNMKVLHPFVFHPYTRKYEDVVTTELILLVFSTLYLLLGWAIGKTIGRYNRPGDIRLARWAVVISFVALSVSIHVGLGTFLALFSGRPIHFYPNLKMVVFHFLFSLWGVFAFSLVTYCGYRFSLKDSALSESPAKEPSTLAVMAVGFIAALVFAAPLGLLLVIVGKVSTFLVPSYTIQTLLSRSTLLLGALNGLFIGLLIRYKFGGLEKKFAWMGAAFSVFACEFAVFYLTLWTNLSGYDVRYLLRGDLSRLSSLAYSFYRSPYHILSALWIVGSLFLAYWVSVPNEEENDGDLLSSFEKKSLSAYLVVSCLCLIAAWSTRSPRVDILLFQATRVGDTKIVLEALKKGANIVARDGAGKTPLLIAAWCNQRNVVRLLIEKGADIHAPCGKVVDDMDTPLKRAAYCFDIKTFELFLSKVPDEKTRNLYWEKFLAAAVFGKKRELINSLIEREQEPKKRQSILDRGLLSAFFYENEELIQFFLKKGANIDGGKKDGLPAIIFALSKSRFSMLKSLVKHGANVNACDDKGKTALMYALELYNAELVELLLKKGSDAYQKDTQGVSALYNALLQNGSMVDVILKHQRLHFAFLTDLLTRKDERIYLSDGELVRLVNKCVDFSPIGEHCEKLVEYCVRGKKSGLLEHLLKKGANPNIKTADGKSMLELAKEQRADAIAYLLEQSITRQGK